MKKSILFSFFFSFVFSSWAQGVQWGLNIAPGISYRMAQAKNLTNHAQSIQNGEKAMYVFDFGIDLRKNISHRLSIGTGIFYSQKGFSNIHVAAVYDDPTLSRRYILDFVQDYLEVPFYLKYDVYQTDQIQFYPLLGVNNSLLLNEKNNVAAIGEEVSEETMERLSQPYLGSARLHNIGIVGGFGMMGAVDSKTAIGMEALGKVMFTPLMDGFSDTHRNLYSLNLNFKFVRKIR